MGFDFEKLEIYQEAVEYADELYRLTRQFPRDELFGLTGQLRRAGVSVALNIAEGSGRLKGEFKQFLRIARTSVYECIAIMQIALKQKYIAEQQYKKCYLNGERIAKRINALIRSLHREP